MAETHSSPKTTAATRKRQQRARALENYGVRSWTIDVTPQEMAWLRKAYNRRFGHDWSLSARQQALAKPAPNDDTEQLGLFTT